LKVTFITPSGTTVVKASSGANFTLLLETCMKNQLRIIAAGLGLAVGGLSLFSVSASAMSASGVAAISKVNHVSDAIGLPVEHVQYYPYGLAAIMGAGSAVAVIMGADSAVMEVAVTAPGIADHCSPVWKPQVQGDTRTRSH
jgi:hypothetical protein